ncbi:MAG: hypothetical protein HY875_02295 [Chloroflexi bacterium]|nr:hypothetical protein [Chloroflexota bacterium]
MKRLLALAEEAWLWTYTAGLPPEEGDDRRAEIRSDQWEYQHACSGRPRVERLARLTGGIADDVAWRARFGRDGLSKARAHETLLLVAIAGFVVFTIPASVWWAVALAGDPGQPGLQVWYVVSTALSLACAVVGGAASAAYYPRAGRTLMSAGVLGISGTLWWTPLAFLVGAAGIATILALPKRTEVPPLRN